MSQRTASVVTRDFMVKHKTFLIFFLDYKLYVFYETKIINTILKFDHSITVFKCQGNSPESMTYSSNKVRIFSAFKFRFILWLLPSDQLCCLMKHFYAITSKKSHCVEFYRQNLLEYSHISIFNLKTLWNASVASTRAEALYLLR